MTAFRVSEAASLLGVSDDTVRRWIDAGRVEIVAGSPVRVDGVGLAALAVETARAADDPSGVARSARNRFVGLVTRIEADGIMAQVDIQAGPHRVVSLLSREAVDEMGLAVGSLAVAVVKATNVIIETPRS